MNKILVVTLCLLLSVNALAQPKPVIACSKEKTLSQGNFLILNQGNITSGVIYLISNHSTKKILLDHPSDRSMHAGWSSLLEPGNVSALTMNRKNFALSCSIDNHGHYELKNCQSLVDVCRVTAYSVGPDQGNYWLVENVSPKDVEMKIKTRLTEQ